MITLLAIISVVLLAALIAMLLAYMRLLASHSAKAKENEQFVNDNERLCCELKESKNELLASKVRVALLENENSAMGERLEAQKEQFRETMGQMRHEFRTMAVEALEKNTEQFSRQSQERLESMLLPFGKDLKQFREKVENY